MQVVGGDSLYKYALPFRSNRLNSYFDLSSRSVVVGFHEPNTVIFQVRSAPACVWLVRTGNARLIFPSKGKVRSISRPTVLGELIGLSETIAQIAYGATLTADPECTCVSISRADLMEILLRDANLKEELLSKLSEGLNEAMMLGRKEM